jgi:hypothetical protein
MMRAYINTEDETRNVYVIWWESLTKNDKAQYFEYGRIIYALGLLTLENGTDKLSRNVGK